VRSTEEAERPSHPVDNVADTGSPRRITERENRMFHDAKWVELRVLVPAHLFALIEADRRRAVVPPDRFITEALAAAVAEHLDQDDVDDVLRCVTRDMQRQADE
jgi:hypothetical protein